MERFGINPEDQEVTSGHGTDADRLARPWTVFVFGVLLSVALAIVVFVRTSDTGVMDDKVSLGMLAFAAIAVLLSAAYAFVGAKHGRAKARRLVGGAGLLVILLGVAALVYGLLVMAP